MALLYSFCFLGVETVQYLYIAVSGTVLSEMLLVGCHVIFSNQFIVIISSDLKGCLT